MGEFIKCGTMFKNDSSHQGSGQVKKKGRNISKDKYKDQKEGPGHRKDKTQTDLEK